jgi:glycerophosphoryl diester phosphodiesterase
MRVDLPGLIGHRGAAAVAPENTLASLSAAQKAGARWVEVDVKLSADNVAILMHDDLLDRTTNGVGPVREKTWAEIARLDAGRWFGEAFTGEAVPTLSAALDRLRALNLGLNLEIKPCVGRGAETAAVAVDILAAHQFPPERLLLTSFDWRAISWCADHAPTWSCGLLCDDLNCDWQRTATALGCVSIHVDQQALTAAHIAEIHRAGFLAAAYTVNDSARAATLRAAGLDAIITDDPSGLLASMPPCDR